MTAMRRRAIRRFGALLPPTNHPIVFTYLLIFIFAAVAGAERFPAVGREPSDAHLTLTRRDLSTTPHSDRSFLA